MSAARVVSELGARELLVCESKNNVNKTVTIDKR